MIDDSEVNAILDLPPCFQCLPAYTLVLGLCSKWLVSSFSVPAVDAVLLSSFHCLSLAAVELYAVSPGVTARKAHLLAT